MDDAISYVRCNSMQTKDAEESIIEFAHLFTWKENETVLDVGSGPGDVTSRVLRAFVPNDAEVIGSDMTEKMVAFANSQFNEEGLSFRKLNIENVAWDSWKRRSFDKIFSFYCLHWINDQKLAVENIFNLLKPEGQLFLVFLAQSPVFELYKKLSEVSNWAPYMKDVEDFICPYHDSSDAGAEFERLLTEQKFTKIKLAYKTKTFSYDSTQHLLSSIIAVNPFTKRIPADLISSYKKDIIKLSLELVNVKDDHEGPLEVNYSIIVAYAVKPKS